MRLKIILLVILILYFAYDVIIDMMAEPGFGADNLIEAAMFSAAAILLILEIRSMQQLTVAFKEIQDQNKVLSSQLSDMIESRFSGWNLTTAESETAWLLIKGFSISEISRLRDVKEKTVHHQLTSIYAKSNTRNRSDFTSLFIQAMFDGSHKKA